MKKYKLLTVLLILMFTLNLKGKDLGRLQTPYIISSNMVLQHGQKISVWGSASVNEQIQVSFGKQRLKTRADKKGKWIVELQPMEVDKTSKQLVIKGKKTNIVYDNILVGEVWLCSGQSNMQYAMKRYHTFLPPQKGEDLEALERQKPANNMIRVFVADKKQTWKSWQVADGKSIEDVSSAGYFFGKAIQEKLNVPVGIITAAVGGSRIETWTPKDAYEKSPIFANELKNEGKVDNLEPSQYYNQILINVIPYTVKGFLWYQGENNCGIRDRRYAEKYQVMVNAWRDAFNLEKAPFYSVILAPYRYSSKLHRGGPSLTAEELPFFREQQKKGTTMVPNSEYVVVSDLIDDWREIHPPYKWEVGARLARLALAKDYGFKDIVWSGPRFDKAESAGDSIIVAFKHCANGLKTNDDRRLNWFEVAAKDGIFHPAVADVKDKNKVVVYCFDVKQPVFVRFGWHETSVPNLVNSEGLPAAPFTSMPK